MRITRIGLLFVFLMQLGACGWLNSRVPSNSVSADVVMPAMNSFAKTQPVAVSRSNSSIASDFIALAFQLESGRVLPVLSRFEGPITLRAIGAAPTTMERDLRALLKRLRDEAGLDIELIGRTVHANITIEFVAARALKRKVPNAACFVAPNVSSWQEFLQSRRDGTGDWTQLRERRRMAIFLPGNVSPQEVRDCLHEELAQALGPVNDLYHLTDSVFNDDNFHTVLTSFDMLILRVFYDAQLRSGMTVQTVASLLPDIFARVNPAGGAVQRMSPTVTPNNWKAAINGALGASQSTSGRRQLAERAVAIARGHGWNDHRLAFSLFAYGRMTLASDPARALDAFDRAADIYGRDAATNIHAAHVGVQRAAHSLGANRPLQAINTVNLHLGTALDAKNASLLATLLMIKAAALDDLGKHAQSETVRLDSLGWARYGFGSDADIRHRLKEISNLSRSTRKNSSS